jgi:hypothetical protein
MQPVLTFNIIAMKNENFEKKLTEMSKPEISRLKHEEMLADAIINAKDKSVVSLWWLSVPLFVIGMLLMKSLYMPGTDLISNLHDLASRQKNISLIFFLASPLIIILINALSIRKIYFLSGSPKSFRFLESVWVNIVVIIACLVILLIYSL